MALSKNSTRTMIVVMIMLVVYAIAINVENHQGTQRYSVSALQADGAVLKFECLAMMPAITKEMELRKTKGVRQISRQKMDIVLKLWRC